MSNKYRENMLDKYFSACTNKEKTNIESYTKKYLDNLYPVWIENGVEEEEKIKKGKKPTTYLRPVEEKLVEGIKNYFEYKGSFAASLSWGMSDIIGKRSICDFIDKKESWTNIISRWLTYASDVITSGSKEFSAELFKDVKIIGLDGKEVEVKNILQSLQVFLIGDL